jgi:DNA-directed RNA polymerase subunit omega
MARITIEDCIEKVPNRFHLVQMAAIRAKQLKQGATTLVPAEHNKAVVIALREIAAGRVHPDYPEEDEPGSEESPAAAAAKAPSSGDGSTTSD